MLNPRLETFYEKIICEDFILLYNLTNITLLPNFEKAILSSTSKNFGSSRSDVLQSFCAWQLSTSEKNITTRAHKSIAFFNIRKDTLLGLKVTLRKKTLFSFLDKTLIFVLPISVTNNNDNYKEEQRNQKFFKEATFRTALPKTLLKEKVDITLLSYMQNQPKDMILSLPAFLRARKSKKTLSRNDIVKQSYTCNEVKQKKENVAFTNKLNKNWEEQEKMPFSINFFDNITLSENYTLQADANTNLFYLKQNKKSKYFYLFKYFNTNNNGLPVGLPLPKPSALASRMTKTNKKSKSFFIVSDRSALSLPEISSISPFFDLLSGFSLTVSLKKSKLLHNYSFTRKDLIKNQLLSALAFPKR